MQVYAAVERHVDWTVVRCLVIAGPGFMKDQFKEYLHAEAVRRDTRSAIPDTLLADSAWLGSAGTICHGTRPSLPLRNAVSRLSRAVRFAGTLILNKTKIVVAQASSAYKHSLREVLESPGIAGQIKVGYCCLPSHLEGFM